MKTVHYSRAGYNGDYTYDSVCGQKVKTHQEYERTSIHPEEANCKKCLATREYNVDTKKATSGVKTRIYIESDILHADEFHSAQREASDFAKTNKERCVDRVFSEVLDFAWHDLDKTWEAIKRADEIYATTSLIPLCGGYSGAPLIFNKMCERAVKENITGKSIIILNSLKHISWESIDIEVMKKTFKKNHLFLYDEKYSLVKIDTSKIKR